MRYPNWRKTPGTPEVPSYSPEYVEVEFSEVSGIKLGRTCARRNDVAY